VQLWLLLIVVFGFFFFLPAQPFVASISLWHIAFYLPARRQSCKKNVCSFKINLLQLSMQIATFIELLLPWLSCCVAIIMIANASARK